MILYVILTLTTISLLVLILSNALVKKYDLLICCFLLLIVHSIFGWGFIGNYYTVNENKYIINAPIHINRLELNGQYLAQFIYVVDGNITTINKTDSKYWELSKNSNEFVIVKTDRYNLYKRIFNVYYDLYHISETNNLNLTK